MNERDDVTPAEASSIKSREQIAQQALIARALKLHDLERWLLSLAQELAAGRIKEWEEEGARFEAQFRRRWVDIETFVMSRWP